MPPQGLGMYQNGFPVGYPTNNLYNPNQTQFTQQQQNQSQSQQSPPINDTLVFVEGENSAKAYMMSKNTRMALWDSKEQKIYLKTTDVNGIPSTQVLEYKIIEPVKLEDKFLTKEEFTKTLNDSLSKIITELKGALANESSLSANAPVKSTESDSTTV